jgi:plasmid stabilization system protein ParE
MTEVVLHERAVNDIEEIVRYLLEHADADVAEMTRALIAS